MREGREGRMGRKKRKDDKRGLVTCSSTFQVGPSTTSLGTGKHQWPVLPTPVPKEGEKRG